MQAFNQTSEFSEEWLSRLIGAISGLNWIFYVIGVAGSIVSFGATRQTYGAALLAGFYVVGMQITPRARLRLPIIRELAALAAATLSAGAVLVTGTLQSPYLLLTLTPIILASILAGIRLGVATGALVAGLFALAELPQTDRDLIGLLGWLGLALLAAVTFALARRLLLDAMERVDLLTRMSAETGARLEALENANRLLTRLSDLTEATDVSPEDIGAAALQSIREAVPFDRATVWMRTTDGAVEVATSGGSADTGQKATVPIALGDHELGWAELHTAVSLSARQLEAVRSLLQPTAVGFSNRELISRIARNAIHDERLRVARELHDGLGPGLASLGLALDVEMLNSPGDRRAQLGALRDKVTDLVSDVRSTVGELRQTHLPSLREAAEDAALQARLDLTFTVDPAPADLTLLRELNPIVVEAIRNAGRHSGSRTVAVSGHAVDESGRIAIADDGRGFDPAAVDDGHFGLMGIRERAARIGASVTVDSAPGRSTTITVEWPA